MEARKRSAGPGGLPWTIAAILALWMGHAPVAHARADTWRQTRFLLGGWVLDRAPDDPQQLVRLAAAGLDYVHDNDHPAEWDNQRRLVSRLDSLATRRPGFRLQAILHRKGPANDPGRFTANRDAGHAWPDIRRGLTDLPPTHHAASPGWFVWDEPCDRAAMAAATAMVRQLRADPATRGGPPLVNLLPSPDAGNTSCLLRYDGGPRDSVWVRYAEEYLRAFDADPLPAPCLSFDRYPFELDGVVDPGYFENLRWARDLAARHGRPGAPVPLWVVIQVSRFKPAGRPVMHGPSVAQVRWQAWCAVAYGARSISYWMLRASPRNDRFDQFEDGLLDAAGQPTALYGPMVALGRDLHAIGDALFSLRPTATLVADALEQTIAPEESLARPERADHVVEQVMPDSGWAECMIGHFRDARGRIDELLVVNRDLAQPHAFRLRLGAVADSISTFDPATRRFHLVARGKDAIALPAIAPASALLVRLAHAAPAPAPRRSASQPGR